MGEHMKFVPIAWVAAGIATAGAATPPPVDVSAAYSDGNGGLVMHFPGPVQCENAGDPEVVELARPMNVLGPNGADQREPVTMIFAIDENGRTISIAPDQEANRFHTDDFSAALAASRFASSSPRTNCRISYTAKFAPFADAPLAELVSYDITANNQSLPRNAWQRIYGQGNCMEAPIVEPLSVAHPDLDKIPGKRGSRDWTMASFDIEADGRTRNVRVVAGTGNAALDTATIEAVARSRYRGRLPRHGCSIPYWRNADILPAPSTFSDLPSTSDAACEYVRWDREPVLHYPMEFERRLIEGWAIVRYSYAPWGEISDVEVVDAQPSSVFGDAAKAMLMRAKRSRSEFGASGCYQRVDYRMG
ncbi:MAG: hypothetical protein DI637_03795 [Citromicrobium sp.]|nr:MAG: hypothetical protein DI637_03795 [Citromicrobium sp.]